MQKLSEKMPADGFVTVLREGLEIDHALSWLPVIISDKKHIGVVRGFKVENGELYGAYGFRQSVADYAKKHPDAEFEQVAKL